MPKSIPIQSVPKAFQDPRCPIDDATLNIVVLRDHDGHPDDQGHLPQAIVGSAGIERVVVPVQFLASSLRECDCRSHVQSIFSSIIGYDDRTS